MPCSGPGAPGFKVAASRVSGLGGLGFRGLGVSGFGLRGFRGFRV